MIQKRKIILTTCLAILLTFGCIKLQAQKLTKTVPLTSPQNTVVLKGLLKNFENGVLIDDESDLGNLLPGTTERLIIPDSQGRFSIKFNLKNPNYFLIGRNMLYLSPGDDMEIFINCNDPDSATFKGNGHVANTYLCGTLSPKGGSFIAGGRIVQKKAGATIDTILAKAAQRQKELVGLKGISAEFRRLENARIKADIINSLLCGVKYYLPREMSKEAVAQYKAEFNAKATPIINQYGKGLIDASLLKLAVYRDIADTLSHQPGNKNDLQQIKEWIKAYEFVYKMKETGDKQKLKIFIPQINALRTTLYKNALHATLTKLLSFGNGDAAIDFMATDMVGNKISLSSLKGKVIYVDIWATWCIPCRQEIPYFEKLKEKYKDNPNVAMVSLSIDDEVEMWRKFVIEDKRNGLQWRINYNSLNDYNIVGIPRAFLINKDFIIEDINAPVPSDEKLPGMIDKLL